MTIVLSLDEYTLAKKSKFGHSVLAEKIVKKFGTKDPNEQKVSVQMNNADQIRVFTQKIEQAQKKTKESKLIFR